ncbi:unnamed protein product [Lymnaea stagnalis]|uniref:GIY-YIG domain-containing protein n=1 Tax=Lymnaea stagnalis TaxID=6523 RepID=A0AAV2HMC5_LYMST
MDETLKIYDSAHSDKETDLNDELNALVLDMDETLKIVDTDSNDDMETVDTGSNDGLETVASQKDPTYLALLKQFPFIEKNENIRRVMVALHKLQHQELSNPKQCYPGQRCIFCDYYFLKMMGDKYNGKASKSMICDETSVVFLVFCINCDEVLLGSTIGKMTMKDLAVINFGFNGKLKCEPQNCHNRKSLKCLIINTKNLPPNNNLSVWKKELNVEELDLKPEVLKFNESHELGFSEIKKLNLDIKELPYDSVFIIYYIKCKHCAKYYIGKTRETFSKRYPNTFCDNYTKGAFHKHTLGVNSECTVRDLQFRVIYSLNEEQTFFLHKWTYIFNNCPIDLKKKISWVIEVDKSSKNDLMKIVWDNHTKKDIIDLIQKLIQRIKASDEEFNKEEYKDMDAEKILRDKNIKWIKKTKEIIFEKKEKLWMNKFKEKFGAENALNLYEIAESKNESASLYCDFYEKLQV